MEKERRSEFDIAKAIAIYLVVVGHVRNRALYDAGARIWFLHMPVFFFISGYFAEKSLCKYSIKEFCKKKVETLLIPFFLWSLISLFLNSILGIMQKSFTYNFFLEEVKAIFIYARSVWFLAILFFSLIFYMVIRKIFSDKFLFISGFLLWIIASCLLPDDILQLYKFKWLFPFFSVGAMWNRKNKESKDINIFWVLVGCVIFYAMSTYLYPKKIFEACITFNYCSLKDIAGGCLCYLISFIGIWDVLQVSGYIKNIRILEKILCMVGRYSMDIYMIHMLLVKVIFFMPAVLRENQIWGNIYIYVYSLFIIIFIIIICKLVLDKNALYSISVGKQRPLRNK